MVALFTNMQMLLSGLTDSALSGGRSKRTTSETRAGSSSWRNESLRYSEGHEFAVEFRVGEKQNTRDCCLGV